MAEAGVAEADAAEAAACSVGSGPAADRALRALHAQDLDGAEAAAVGLDGRTAGEASDQAPEAQSEQPHAGDGKRRERQARREGQHDVIAVERPVPKEVVAESESGHDGKGL